MFVFWEQFKVLYSIIAFFAIKMMNCLPRFKGSIQMFCHNKAMFKNIPIPVSHWMISHFDFYISIPIYNATSMFPTSMKFWRSRLGWPLSFQPNFFHGTAFTSITLLRYIFFANPAFTPTIWTCNEQTSSGFAAEIKCFFYHKLNITYY